jgi:hypothetical protein
MDESGAMGAAVALGVAVVEAGAIDIVTVLVFASRAVVLLR